MLISFSLVVFKNVHLDVLKFMSPAPTVPLNSRLMHYVSSFHLLEDLFYSKIILSVARSDFDTSPFPSVVQLFLHV